MKKSEVYDYLARIYLDKQPCAGNKNKFAYPKRYALFLIIPLIAIPLIYLFLRYPFKLFRAKTYGLYLATGNEQIKIKYNFANSTLKKEGYTITLSGLGLEDFKLLQFAARRLKNYGAANLRVELENNLKENSSYYVKGIGNKWRQWTIKLSDFKEITRWDNLRRLSFVVEEWNILDNDDCIYIDDIRFTKETGGG